jgi:hypothetical protein
MYTFSKTSNHVRLFKWFWGVDPTSEYKNMCPYFWSWVATTIIFPIILLWKLFVFVVPKSEKLEMAGDYISNSKVGKTMGKATVFVIEQPKFWGGVEKILQWGWIAFICSLGLGILGFTGYRFYIDPMEVFAYIGIIATLIGIIALIVWGYEEFEDDIQDIRIWSRIWYPFKLIGNMIYNFYKGICPLITWK